MSWIVVAAALLVVFFLDGPVALAVVAAVLAWLGIQVQRQAQQIKKLAERLDTLDPPSTDQNAAQTVALANASIEPEATGQAATGWLDEPPVPADSANTHAAATRAPETTNATIESSAGAAHESNRKSGELLAPLTKLVVGYFTGGNLIVRIGVVVLFFGLSFLAKFSIENGLIPVEWRLAAMATVACALLAFGWRLKDKSPAYALVLQGAGVAALYLVVFSALRLYQLLPPMFAFGLLLLISLFAMLLAVKQNSRALAITAITGAFACPILTSDGSGNHVALFGYYALLNFTVFSIAWFKSWRLLNLIAFAFTFLVATVWGVLRYEHGEYQSAQLFLLLFGLQFIAIAVVFACRQPPRLKGLVDGTLIFGTPLIGFGLQSQLVEPFEYGLAYSALALGIFYLLLGALMLWWARPAMQLLAESFLALGLIFSTLAFPLAFDATWSSAAWAIEGAAFVWLAQRQRKLPLLLFGFLLQAGAFVFYIAAIDQLQPVWNQTTLLGSTVIAICALTTALQTAQGTLFNSHRQRISIGFAMWAILLWYGGGCLHIMELLSGFQQHVTLLLFIIASALAGWFVNRRAQHPVLAQLPWVSTLLLALSVISWPAPDTVIAWLQLALLWLSALAAQYFLLARTLPRDPPSLAANWLHSFSWLLVLAIGLLLSYSMLELFDIARAWQHASAAVLVSLALLWPVLLKRWPFDQHALAFGTFAATPILGLLWLWTLGNIATVLPSTPLPYWPLLNPMDLAQLIAIASFFGWRSRLASAHTPSESRKNWLLAGGLVVFLWATSLLLKTLHVWQEIPYTAGDLFYSPTVQTSLSIFWTIVGLCTAVYATHSHRRVVWFCAAALLAVVVAKLFLIDLTDQDSITRIASFVGVGGLLLVVGYFAPLPPAEQQPAADAEPT